MKSQDTSNNFLECEQCGATLLSTEKICLFCGTTRKKVILKFPSLKEDTKNEQQHKYKEKARLKNEQKYNEGLQ